MTTHTPSNRLLVCLVAAAVALAPLLVGAAAGATDTGATDGVEQVQTDGELTLEVTERTDDTVTVTLSTSVENVAGYQAHLTFDPAATAVESVEGGEGAFDIEPVQTVDNENGSVNFNQIAEGAPDNAVDAPTMATITFERPDTPTAVSFVAEDSLVATGELEDVTDLTRDGVTLSSDGSDGGDGGAGSGGGDGGAGSGGGDGGAGSGGGDGGAGSVGGGAGDGGDGGDAGDGGDGGDAEDGGDDADTEDGGAEDGGDDADDGNDADGGDENAGGDGGDGGDGSGGGDESAGGPVLEEQAPGFGPVLTLIALLGSALVFGRLARRSQE